MVKRVHVVMVVFEGEGAGRLAWDAANGVDQFFGGDLSVTCAEMDMDILKEAIL